MESAIKILRNLFIHRVIVAVFAIVALAIATLVAYKPGFPPQSRKYRVGSGHVQILIDTPASQVVEINPQGADGLGSRAGLLANLMIGGEVKQAIAQAAGLRPDQLIATSDSALAPANVTPAQLKNPHALILKTSVVTNDDGTDLPIVSVQTQAPDARRAAAIANAAVTGLKQYLDSRAAREGVPDGQRLQVRGLGGAQAGDVAKGPGNMLALAAFIFIFGALCGGLLLVVALAHGMRESTDEARWQVTEEERRDDGWEDDDPTFDFVPPSEPAMAPVTPIAPKGAPPVPPPPSASKGGWAAAPPASPQTGVGASRK
jgi:hypothetical protein